MTDLAPFPTDDAALSAVEHALGAALTFDRPDGADPDDEGPFVVGADFPLARVLDFYSGTLDDVGVELIEGDPELAALGLGGSLVYLDERPHYTERDVIAALIAEVRRLRELD